MKLLTMLELRKMNYEDVEEQWKYVTQLPTNENGLTNQYEGISFDEYKDTVLPELMMHENPVNMPEWFVPETFYYLWDENVIVGEYRIRHHLTEVLKTGAGHIGYSIKKEFRGKGYGTKGLALALDVARKLASEEEIYLRVLKSNIPSYKAICNNGAYVVDETGSGCICIGMDDGKRKYFCKIAGVNTLEADVSLEESVKILKEAVCLYDDLAHPNLIKIIEEYDYRQFYVVVFEWANGNGRLRIIFINKY